MKKILILIGLGILLMPEISLGQRGRYSLFQAKYQKHYSQMWQNEDKVFEIKEEASVTDTVITVFKIDTETGQVWYLYHMSDLWVNADSSAKMLTGFGWKEISDYDTTSTPVSVSK
jgi:hypothetical protein